MPKVGALYFQNVVHTLFKLPYLHANNNNTKKKGITESAIGLYNQLTRSFEDELDDQRLS